MKLNKEIVIALIIMIVTSALYRVLPGRPFGFAPQIAIALFSGSLFVKNKHFAFLLPIVSMFLSDLLYQVLYVNYLTTIQGFYDGQWQNYLLIAATAIFGFGLQITCPEILSRKNNNLSFPFSSIPLTMFLPSSTTLLLISTG